MKKNKKKKKKKKKYIFFIVVYILAIVATIVFSILFPNKYSNIFSSINGFVASASAIMLGCLALWQERRHKEEIDKKNEDMDIKNKKPIVIIVLLDDDNNQNTDLICDCASDIQKENINFSVCSLNRAIVNFRINKIVINNTSCFEDWDNKDGSNKERSNIIFLQDTLYKISILVPKLSDTNEVEAMFSLKNAHFENYEKRIVFQKTDSKWNIIQSNECETIEGK